MNGNRLASLAALALLACFALVAPVRAQHYDRGVILCESIDFRDNYCPVNTRGGVRLLRQVSKSHCYEGETWGYDRRGIWVTQGCAGEFEIGGGSRGFGADHGYAPRHDPHDQGYGRGRRGGGQHIVCESRDYHYNYCAVHIGRDVDLVAQFSKTECRHGRTWGWDRGGIWVDRGCGGEFVVY